MSKSRDYAYSPPSYDAAVDRAERKGSILDLMFKDAKIYRPKQGANLLRILPPGWPKAAHYGLTIKIHRGVGPSDRQYLCLRENPTSPHKRCPICEELYKLGAKASQEDRQALRAATSIAYYVIDRDNEKDGVQVWMSSPTTDSEIAAQSVNRRTKSVIDIVHPEEGYDIEFTRSGATKNNTRYRGFQVMREPSPLSDSERRADEWLDVAFDKPLPSLLQFYTPEHIEEVFYGQAKVDEADDKPRTSVRDRDAEEDRPLRRTREPEVAEEDRPVRRRPADDDEEEKPEPRSRRRSADEEEEERPARSSRSRTADDDDDEPARPERSRVRSRVIDDDNDNDETSTQRAKERPARDADDEDEPPRARSRLSRELDDDIPSEGSRRARPNGRDTEEERPARAAARRRPTDDDDDDVKVDKESTEDRHQARRERVRARLDRE